MSNEKGQLSMRIWTGIILFMFMGSVAAGVESIYLSMFLDNTVYKDGAMGASITLTDAVNLIASLTAVVSGITTFVMGTLSEKLKNRRNFISVGFIAWGIIMLIFSAVRKGNVANLFGLGYNDAAEIITAMAVTVVSFTLILAFLRSTTNDAAFHSWLTDISTPESSPKIEIAFTVMGFAATGFITYLVTNAELEIIDYSTICVIFGVIAISLGISGFFLIDNPDNPQKDEEDRSGYWSDLFYGFRPSTVKKNINLYLMLLSGCLFNIAYQVFYPYLFIYISSVIIPANEELNINPLMLIITAVIAAVVVIACVLLFMKVYAFDKGASFIASVLCLVAGLLILASTKSLVGIIIGLTPGLIGYIIIMIQFGATVRDNIPKDKAGLFQGIRMIFLIFVPKIIGPTLGNIAAKNSEVTYMENGAEKVLPTEAMFLYAAIIAALIFIPMLPFLKKDREKAKKV